MSNRLNTTSPYLDMVVSHLRLQITSLNSVLETVERTHTYEDEYIRESIKTVEKELHRLRKFIH